MVDDAFLDYIVLYMFHHFLCSHYAAFFHSYVRHKWRDVHQTKTKMIDCPFYVVKYFSNIFHFL